MIWSIKMPNSTIFQLRWEMLRWLHSCVMLHSKTERGVDMATVKSSPLSETPQNRQPLLPSSPTLGGSNGIATKLWKRDTLSYMAFRGHAETHLPEEGRFAKLRFAEIICLITPRLRIQPLHGPFTVELDFMILVEPFQLRIFCDSMIYGAPWRMRWKRCY